MKCGQLGHQEFMLMRIKPLITKELVVIRLPIRGTFFVVKDNLNNLNIPLLGGDIKIGI